MPATVVEAKAAPFKRTPVDPITLDIVENALRNARVEMDAVLFRTAMSPGIREQHDAFPMIANQEGKMVVGQFGSFLHGFIAGYDGTIEDGDVFLTNDPYSCAGAISHLNDWLADDADLPRRPARLLGRDVRPYDRCRRKGAGIPADRRQDDLRGRHHHSPGQDLSATAS